MNKAIVHVKKINNRNIGIYRLIYTYGLISDYPDKEDYSATLYTNRFCYPMSEYTLLEVIQFANQWDLENPPHEGWTKYKGVLGELLPTETHRVKPMLEAVTRGVLAGTL